MAKKKKEEQKNVTEEAQVQEAAQEASAAQEAAPSEDVKEMELAAYRRAEEMERRVSQRARMLSTQPGR